VRDGGAGHKAGSIPRQPSQGRRAHPSPQCARPGCPVPQASACEHRRGAGDRPCRGPSRRHRSRAFVRRSKNRGRRGQLGAAGGRRSLPALSAIVSKAELQAGSSDPAVLWLCRRRDRVSCAALPLRQPPAAPATSPFALRENGEDLILGDPPYFCKAQMGRGTAGAARGGGGTTPKRRQRPSVSGKSPRARRGGRRGKLTQSYGDPDHLQSRSGHRRIRRASLFECQAPPRG
jgi:hypothetical protein